ncbi:glycoside hydrolase family 2 protein [Secundilactobacillus yichangensis]|uniref:glycoside hydrolase family 2 protein n=1 Tax=Secundilactobacillus yichangensis TaxID=2799580 RepID=UPI0019430006|nr:sugar-binding domain-containing protein [Secundilactobacillus yichangensis]
MNRLDFPNPQKIRTNWFDLNGKWDFYLDKKNESASGGPLPLSSFNQKIVVPYSYTFKKSGLAVDDYYPVVWYHRTFNLDKQPGKHYLLHFEAVDYKCDIWLNDNLVFHHQGGHTPFEIDVTDWVKKDNDLELKVVDTNDPTQPIGKQSWHDGNFLCWYTRTIGIWQSVWLEETGSTYLTNFILKPDIHDASLNIDAYANNDDSAKLTATVSYQGRKIVEGSASFKNGRARLSMDVSDEKAAFRLYYWTVNDPQLYDVDLKVTDEHGDSDAVSSYFGMRNVETANRRVYLNREELYMKLVLNQGYYPDAGLTGTVDDFKGDIEKLQAMGFNGNRIHEKIESNKMLYLCDKLGFICTAEIPSTFEFSQKSTQNIDTELNAFVQKHINHPAVLAYVIMNESWGVNEIANNTAEQTYVDAVYYRIKAMDDTRLISSNDGWEQTKTDLCTAHDYDTNTEVIKKRYADLQTVTNGSPSLSNGRRLFCKGYEDQKVPFLLSEFGGIAYETEHRSDSWGYGDRLASKEDVLKTMSALIKQVMAIDFCSGFCYTQVSDVEQEVNGLLDHNHDYKFDPKEIRAIVTSDRQYGLQVN